MDGDWGPEPQEEQEDIEIEVFNDSILQNFKDIGSSVDAHTKAIWKFRKDESRTVLAVTSIQGSGKTTSIIDVFAKSRDAILITQSNDKLEEIVSIIDKRYPDLEYHAIWGLERSCVTYLDDDCKQSKEAHKELLEKVGRYREIGIHTRDIHTLICSEKDCDFVTQDITFEGRVVQTVDRFIQQITFGKLFKGLHPNRLILMDEGDGLLGTKAIDPIVAVALEDYRKEIVQNTSAFLPDIREIIVPEGEITKLTEKYKELLTDIDGNKDLIEQVTGLIRILTHGYFIKDEKLLEIPTFFLLTQKVMWQKMKLVIGTASMRNHRIKFKTLNDYFRLALSLLFDEVAREATKDKLTPKKFERMVQIYDFLAELDGNIQEFSHNYIPGITNVYGFNSKKHGYSMSHYKQAFKKDADEGARKQVWKEVVQEITLGIRFWELQKNRKAQKVLLITFKDVMFQIERYREKLKKNRHGNRDTVFRNMEILPLFSNRMHGVNATNKEGFDLILTLGDPLDKMFHDFAEKMNIGMANKKGFNLIMKNESLEVKEALLRTLTFELLEAFHRGRGTVDVVALCNFLHQPEPEDQAIIEKILIDDNIQFVDIRSMIEKFRNRTRSRHGTKEMKAFIRSVNEEMNLDLDL